MRWIVSGACAIVFAALALALWGPHTDGVWNADYTGEQSARVTALEPDSPLTKAGMRSGDVIAFTRMPLPQRLAVTLPKAGVAANIAVQRGQTSFVVTAAPLQRARDSSLYFIVKWMLTLLYAGLALLVAWRAPRGRNRTLIVSMLCGLCVAYATYNIADAVPDSGAEALVAIFGTVCIVVFLIAAILFVVIFPPRHTLAQRYVATIGVPICIVAAFLMLVGDIHTVYRFLPMDVERLGSFTQIAAALSMIAGVIDGLTNSTPEYRIPARVAGSTLFALGVVNVVFGLGTLFHWDDPWAPALGLLQWGSGFGVSYAVLRHRLLDLNLVVSRAAIFSAVSLSLIAIFVIAEWALATILERAIGPGFGENGKTALAAAVALCVGLSARGIHRVIEHRLNRVFFAKRYRALADLHRFALETDSTTDATALLELTLNALRRDLDARYVALYTGTPERGYVAVGTNATPNLPLRLDQNEEVVLRLRRWGEAFVVDNEGHPLSRAFVSPMALRGTLYGFSICGPKHDGTAYLPDEEEAVTALIHRVGIAFEWLTRAVPISR